MSVLIETSYGDIVIDLYTVHAPQTCRNFLKLCTLKYYNDCEFFLVRSDFIIQTGDPTNTGTGGTSAQSLCNPPGPFSFTPESSARLTHEKKGTISMVTSKQGDQASQFFITLADGLQYLDFLHTPFGEVAEGLDIVERIGHEFVDNEFRPYRIIRIRHVTVLHDPFDDFDGMPKNVPSPEPAQGGHGDRLGSDEDDDGVEDEARRESLSRLEEEREARSRAEVLEMIGDIADADLKPPENVLFICKLNPITEAEDLEIIFSRFGECGAEILCDKKTGESLCYGFIEFETKSQCEKAYFKMDGTVIDDRRVKVDFSQSVSKLWNAARREKKAVIRDTTVRLAAKRPRTSASSRFNKEPKIGNGTPHTGALRDKVPKQFSGSRSAVGNADPHIDSHEKGRQSRFDVKPD